VKGHCLRRASDGECRKLDQARNAALGARAKARKWSAGILPADVTASRAVTLVAERSS